MTEEPVVTRDDLMIPSALIAKVIHEKQHQIKMNILEEVWKVLFKREF